MESWTLLNGRDSLADLKEMSYIYTPMLIEEMLMWAPMKKLCRASRKKQKIYMNLPSLSMAAYTLKSGLGLNLFFLMCPKKKIFICWIFLSFGVFISSHLKGIWPS